MTREDDIVFNVADKIVIITYKSYHNFSIGDRGEVLEVIGDCCLVECNYVEAIVKNEDIRPYDSLDEYDDMWCDECGGTACHC